jgi:hypothetical protein
MKRKRLYSVGVGCAGQQMRDSVKAQLESSSRRKRRKLSFWPVTCLAVPRDGINIFVAPRHRPHYLSSTATLRSSLNKIVTSRPSTILLIVFLRPLLWVLTRFNFSPGCDISQAGECRKYIIIPIDWLRIVQKAWRNGSEKPKLGTGKILHCLKACFK